MPQDLKSAARSHEADRLAGFDACLVAEPLWDLREQSLIRQGKGWFHISGMGHEALAAALHLEADDYTLTYYRDRAFCVQRGLSDASLAWLFTRSGILQVAGVN